jgi:hypothetical protein
MSPIGSSLSLCTADPDDEEDDGQDDDALNEVADGIAIEFDAVGVTVAVEEERAVLAVNFISRGNDIARDSGRLM